MSSISQNVLLTELHDILKSMPTSSEFFSNPEMCIAWLGRASAAMANWDFSRSIPHFEPLVRQYSSLFANRSTVNFEPFRHSLLVALHQAENDLRLKTVGPVSVGLSTGRVYEYFEELRRLIETAKMDLFFVDPYIDADFVSRYMPHVPNGTHVRILGRERLSALKSAVTAFANQSGLSVEVRTASGFHDRYLFIDDQACYQSGASFKDGAKKAPTVISQVTDAFMAVHSTYTELWRSARAV
jgi:hypothetical protein